MSPEPASTDSTGPEWTGATAGPDASLLIPLVYDELRRIAASLLRHDGNLTLQPTALVHEAFLKLAPPKQASWTDESHFRAVASIAMRQVLSDHVRARKSQKRGSGRRAVAVDLALIGVDAPGSPEDLDAALEQLEAEHPRASSVVIMRFFGGLSVGAVANRLSVSVSVVESDWRFARAWLKRQLEGCGS